jgi:hypothetical protein
MSIISAIKKCNVCRKEKRVVSESLFANGLYGYWCQECDALEGASHPQTSIKVK